MSDDRWPRLLGWAAHRRADPRFDAAERDFRLAVARVASEILRAAVREEPLGPPIDDLSALMRRRRTPRILPGGVMGNLKDWASEDGPALAAVLRAFADETQAPEDRVATLAEVAEPRFPAPAFALGVGSLLNFATAPDRLPLMQVQAFHGLYDLVGEPPPRGSIADLYGRHLRLADRMYEAFVAAGIPTRDMADTEALMLMCWEDRDFWLLDDDERRPRDRPPDVYLAACVVYRDEAPYLAEWLEFGRLVGIERFFLYDNVSVDNHREVLEPYIAEGLVVLHDWPMPYVPGQREAYNHCIANHCEEARWIAFIDVDEFLFSPTYRPVPEVLKEFERWPGVAVNAPRFGTSGHLTKPGGLVIENYVTHMRQDSDRIVKSIVDPAAVESSAGAHVFNYLRRSAVDERGYPVHIGATKTPSFERLRINHYYWKSVEELTERQTGRTAGPGRAWREPPTAEQIARLEAEHGERDETILPYVEPLREALARRARAAR